MLLFNDFETLDVFGPVEILGKHNDKYSIHYYSMDGGLIRNNDGISMLTLKLEELRNAPDVFLIPGGMGTRIEVENKLLIQKINDIAKASQYVLTVCTGSALLAATGLLDHKNATSNKRAFDWVVMMGPDVNWNKKARWVVDGKFYTSSGVSAGMDMTLGFLADRHGMDVAKKIASRIEYNWIADKDNDSFAAR